MAATTTLTVQDTNRTGIAPSYTAASADGFFIPNNGRVILHFKNTGSQSTVTFVTPVTFAGQALADLTATVPATSGDLMVGPFPPEHFNDAAGRILITFSSTTGVTVAAVRVP
jgi:hypothetical protein